MRLARIALIPLLGVVIAFTSACGSSSTSNPTPASTLTPTPTLTPALTAMPTTTALFSDDFSDESRRWYTGEDWFGSASYDNGQLVINSTSETMMVFSELLNRDFSDFILEVETQWLGQTMVGWTFISCRMSYNKDGYYFLISPYGTCAIVKRLGEKYINLVTFYESDRVNKKRNDINLIRIECIGGSLRLSVNGHQLCTKYDFSFTNGTIALGTSLVDGESYKVAFDNLVITEP